jgi:hypothetical protein
MRALLLALVLAASPAVAEDLPAPGNFVLAGDIRLSLRDGGHDVAYAANIRPVTIELMTSIDWLPWRRFTVGVQLSWAHVTATDSTCLLCPRDFYDLGAGGRVGYILPLTDRLALWPRAALSLVRRSSDMGPAYARAVVDTSASLLFAEGGTFFAIGPTLEVDVAAPDTHAHELVLGGGATVGGAF